MNNPGKINKANYNFFFTDVKLALCFEYLMMGQVTFWLRQELKESRCLCVCRSVHVTLCSEWLYKSFCSNLKSPGGSRASRQASKQARRQAVRRQAGKEAGKKANRQAST